MNQQPDRWQAALESLREEDLTFAAAAVRARVEARIRGERRWRWWLLVAAATACCALLFTVIAPRKRAPEDRAAAVAAAHELLLPEAARGMRPLAPQVKRTKPAIRPVAAAAARIEIQTDDPDVVIILVGDDGGD